MRKVLLTTLSTLPKNAKTNYYYAKCYEDGSEKYCTGVYQMEAGVKFLMSKYDVDEIIGIVSDKIVEDNPEMLLDEPQIITAETTFEKTKKGNHGNRENAAFKNSIIEFFGGKQEDCKDNLSEEEKARERFGIDLKRQEEISNMVLEHLNGMSKHEVADYQECYNEISEEIKKDIESNFINEKDYSKYQVDKITQFKEIEEYMLKEWHYKDDFNELWVKHGMKNDTQINKEFYYLQLADFYRQKSIALQGKIDVEEKLIFRLNDANKRFIEEIKSIRDQRITKEQDFAKSLLYHNLAKGKTMCSFNGKKEIRLKYVRERIEGKNIDNIQGIVDSIKGNSDEKVEVYIDMQGGKRTDGYVRQAVMSILNNEIDTNVCTREIIATDYEPKNFINEIVDESGRYSINDLVAGMNAFIQYGKADIIKKYSDTVSAGSEKKLIEAMIEVDDALSLCDTTRLFDALEKIKQHYSEIGKCETIFSVLVDGIKKDYGKLLEGNKIDTIELIEWCMRKKFIQQALTIIESLMPKYFVEKGIVYYADSSNVEEVKAKWSELYKKYRKVKKGKEIYKWNDLDHYFVKYYGHAYRIDDKKITEESHAAYLLGNNDVYINVKTLAANYQDVCNLLDKYIDLCDYRNEANHVNQDKERLGVGDIKKEISVFLESCKQIVAQIDLSKVEIITIPSDKIGHKKKGGNKTKNVNNSGENINVETKEEDNIIVEESPEEVGEDIFVAEKFNNKGALSGRYRKEKAKINKECLFDLVNNGKIKLILTKKVQIEISKAEFKEDEKQYICTPKNVTVMIDELRNNTKKAEG